MSVNINQMNQYFTTYDTNKNNKLDRAEVAKASLNLMGQDDAASQTAGQMFATFVQGGQNGKGLFPDFGNSLAITKNDLSKLATATGKVNVIEGSDFTALFPEQSPGGGAKISVEGLQKTAQGNFNKYTLDPSNPQTFQNSTSALLPAGSEAESLMQGLFTGMQKLIDKFDQLFGSL